MNKTEIIPYEYEGIFMKLAENPNGEWISELDGVEDELSVKSENTAVYIRSLDTEADELRREEDILRARRKAKESIAAKLREYLIERMNAAGVKKFEMPRAFIAVRTNGESLKITDEAKFIGWAKSSEKEYLLKFREPEIIKPAVKECIRNGEDIPYAELVRTNTLTIK